jgi:hypothetical protein
MADNGWSTANAFNGNVRTPITSQSQHGEKGCQRVVEGTIKSQFSWNRRDGLSLPGGQAGG